MSKYKAPVSFVAGGLFVTAVMVLLGMSSDEQRAIDMGMADPPDACPLVSDIPPPLSCSISDAGVPSCAPGATQTDDLEIICGQRTAERRCNFDAAFRKRMLAAYGDTSAGELDHRISLELGGSNAVENIWPEPVDEFRMKDEVENALHRAVCSRQLSLEAARMILLTNWRGFYAGMRTPKKGLLPPERKP
jgi:hypothetical protein